MQPVHTGRTVGARHESGGEESLSPIEPSRRRCRDVDILLAARDTAGRAMTVVSAAFFLTTRRRVPDSLLRAAASPMKLLRAPSHTASKRVLFVELVGKIACIAPEGKVRVLVVVERVRPAQTLAVAGLLVEALGAAVPAVVVQAAGGGAEGVQGDVGGFACAGRRERNLGGVRGFSRNPRARWCGK